MKAKRFTAVLVMALLSVTVIVAKDLRIVVFKVPQMYCENCERKVKDNIRFEKGVKEISTDLKEKTASITYDADKTTVEKLKEGFKKFNYEAEFVKETKKEKKKLNNLQKLILKKHIIFSDMESGLFTRKIQVNISGMRELTMP